jgi:excinuclease ABC subunit C
MLGQMATMDVTVTHTEAEALLLENNLIKAHRPRYNVLLRDDKSYPYIHLTAHRFPRLAFYRGARREPGRYFGPYPNAAAARETLNQLQKLFLLRQCNDTFFSNRSRPCLQYQIKRCSAPCVGHISEDDYRGDVENAVLFLEGRNSAVIDSLVGRMEKAAAEQAYERAAQFRDQIAKLQQAQQRQYVSDTERGDVDVIAAGYRSAVAAVTVMFIRGGRNLGSRTFYPRVHGEPGDDDLLAAFLPQYYLGREIPPEIIVNAAVPDRTLLEDAFSDQAGRRVRIKYSVRAERRRWQAMARANLEQALISRAAAQTGGRKRVAALQEALDLEQPPERIECFDISHTAGESTVASCVVFSEGAPLTSDYRRFNITDIVPGDDYAAMRQALTRRYTRLKRGEGVLPDVLLIDGGRGQVAQAEAVLEELQIEGVVIVGVAKGPTRKPGLEQLFPAGTAAGITLAPDSSALHLIQHVRDEAHRFAIAGHRHRRAKARRTSSLEDIPGLGPKRRGQLLRQFGGLQGIRRAGIEDLARVPGISARLAQRIYDTLHHNG